MKKILIAVLAGVMAVSVCACSHTEKEEFTQSSQESSAVSQSDSSSGESTATSTITSTTDSTEENPIISQFVDTNKLDEKTRKNVTDVLSGDTVDMSASGKLSITGGISIEFNAAAAKKNDSVYLEMECAGKKIKILKNADGKYTIDDENKTATFEKITDDEQTSENLSGGSKVISTLSSYFISSFGLDSIEYKGSGNEEYNGKAYDFEEYSFASGTIKVYYDSDTPVYFVSTTNSGKESVITINKLTTDVSDEIFNIPDGYKIIDNN